MSKRKAPSSSPSNHVRVAVLAAVMDGAKNIPSSFRSETVSTVSLTEACAAFGGAFFKDPITEEAAAAATTNDEDQQPPKKKQRKTSSSRVVDHDEPDNSAIDSQPTPKTTSTKSGGRSRAKKSTTAAAPTIPVQDVVPIVPPSSKPKFNNNIHPCGFVAKSAHYKARHLKDGGCTFIKKLCQFPFCICGFSVHKSVEKWKKASEDGVSELCAKMAEHMAECAKFKKENIEFLKNLQLFATNPNAVIKLYRLTYDHDIGGTPEKNEVAKRIIDDDGTCGCIGCWTSFPDDKTLRLHIGDCRPFKNILQLFSKEMLCTTYYKYYMTNEVSFGDYLNDDACKMYYHKIVKTGQEYLRPFPSPSYNDDDEEEEDENDGDTDVLQQSQEKVVPPSVTNKTVSADNGKKKQPPNSIVSDDGQSTKSNDNHLTATGGDDVEEYDDEMDQGELSSQSLPMSTGKPILEQPVVYQRPNLTHTDTNNNNGGTDKFKPSSWYQPDTPSTRSQIPNTANVTPVVTPSSSLTLRKQIENIDLVRNQKNKVLTQIAQPNNGTPKKLSRTVNVEDDEIDDN